MDSQERTSGLFEIIEGYPKPSQLPKSAFNYNVELKEFNSIQRFIRKSFLKISGFDKFSKNLYNNFENLSRTVDLKSKALFGPVVSASICIKNEQGNIEYTDRAARLILAVIDTYNDILKAKFPVDRYQDEVLEMGQYPNIFSTTQIVENNNVRIFKSNNTNQITVIVNGRFYLLSLTDLNSDESTHQISQTLKKIVEDSRKNKNEGSYNSPGEITATPNNLQKKIFKEIIKIDENSRSLDMLKHSLFTLCLDDENPKDYSETIKITHSKNYFNRWFHSSLQIVVFANANAGLLINFSNYISGNNMMRIGEELYNRALEYSRNNNYNESSTSMLDFERINWQIDAKLLVKPKNLIKRIIDNQNATFEIHSVGEKVFNQKKLAAVPAFVIALQLAVRNYVNEIPRIKQFLTMSKYRCMDLLITDISTEEVIFITEEIYNNDELNKNNYVDLLRSAIDSIKSQTKRQRTHFPLNNQMSLYLNSLTGLKKFILSALNMLSLILIKAFGKTTKFQNDIMISHPKIYDKVPVIGRPGIKIPYTKYFGLHYQIFSDKIVITMMPGLNWKVPNKEFIKILEESLHKIIKIVA